MIGKATFLKKESFSLADFHQLLSSRIFVFSSCDSSFFFQIFVLQFGFVISSVVDMVCSKFNLIWIFNENGAPSYNEIKFFCFKTKDLTLNGWTQCYLWKVVHTRVSKSYQHISGFNFNLSIMFFLNWILGKRKRKLQFMEYVLYLASVSQVKQTKPLMIILASLEIQENILTYRQKYIIKC